MDAQLLPPANSPNASANGAGGDAEKDARSIASAFVVELDVGGTIARRR